MRFRAVVLRYHRNDIHYLFLWRVVWLGVKYLRSSLVPSESSHRRVPPACKPVTACREVDCISAIWSSPTCIFKLVSFSGKQLPGRIKVHKTSFYCPLIRLQRLFCAHVMKEWEKDGSHNITKSQNGWGWHGSLLSSFAQILLKQCYLEQAVQDHVQAFVSPMRETPEPVWAACASTRSCSQ